MIQLEQVGTKHFKHESVRGEIQVQYSHDILRKWVFPFKYLLLPTYSFAYFQKQFAFVICHELYLKTQRMNKMSVNHFCLFSSFKLFFLFTGIHEEGKKPKPSQPEHPFLFIRIKKRLKNQFFFHLCLKNPNSAVPWHAHSFALPTSTTHSPKYDSPASAPCWRQDLCLQGRLTVSNKHKAANKMCCQPTCLRGLTAEANVQGRKHPLHQGALHGTVSLKVFHYFPLFFPPIDPQNLCCMNLFLSHCQSWYNIEL